MKGIVERKKKFPQGFESCSTDKQNKLCKIAYKIVQNCACKIVSSLLPVGSQPCQVKAILIPQTLYSHKTMASPGKAKHLKVGGL